MDGASPENLQLGIATRSTNGVQAKTDGIVVNFNPEVANSLSKAIKNK